MVQGSQLVSQETATRGRQRHGGGEGPAASVGHQHQHPPTSLHVKGSWVGDGGGIIAYEPVILEAGSGGHFG